MKQKGFLGWLKETIVGKPRDLAEKDLFRKLSLIAVLAWIGLGADGLSSSCYGPEESFRALGAHMSLAPLVGLACVLTITVICASYSQIIEAFPGGGGGYLVASKLLSPSLGAVSGCALLVDYVLTIAISVASGADALFSLLPAALLPWKLVFSLTLVAGLTVLNLRGVKESVLIWTPVFFLFLLTHGVAILCAFAFHSDNVTQLVHSTTSDFSSSCSQLGLLGVFLLIIHSYSVGAGTYTGIEAVSNGLPMLREPRVETGKRTMLYMGISLAFMVGGLMLAYLLCKVSPQEGKTLNAVLFESITASWGVGGHLFSWLALLSAACLLFIAAQTGFLDGPRVLANMAADRWFPNRFALLSDRLVAQNGLLLMGAAAFAVLLLSKGAVDFLVVLYSINVFVTFTLSQAGMVRHWWRLRTRYGGWLRKIAVNGVGCAMTGFILVTLCCVKFWEGAWMSLVATGLLIGVAFLTKHHYLSIQRQLKRLDTLADAFLSSPGHFGSNLADPSPRTAAIFVSGFNGTGLHTLLGVQRIFRGNFDNYVFVEVGLVDTGNFKGSGEMERLKTHLKDDCERYVSEMKRLGHSASSVSAIGSDLVQTATELACEVRGRYPNALFFGGQIVFEQESLLSRLLHNYAVFALQRELYKNGIPFVIIPLKL